MEKQVPKEYIEITQQRSKFKAFFDSNIETVKTWKDPFDYNMITFFAAYVPKETWEDVIGKSAIAEEFFTLNKYKESPLTVAFKEIQNR